MCKNTTNQLKKDDELTNTKWGLVRRGKKALDLVVTRYFFASFQNLANIESMENLRLSWDLFVLVFFGIVIAYSFIVGRNQTIKIIIASYMAILMADGLGNLFSAYVLPAAPSLQGEQGVQLLVLMKVFTYVLTIVLLTVKGAFSVEFATERSASSRILSNLMYGFLNAGLLVSTLLVYLTGGSFVLGNVKEGLYTNLYQESQFIQSIVDYYNVWFALPVVVIVVASLFAPHEE